MQQRTADGLHAESYDLMQQDEESEEISNNIKSIVEHVNEVDDTNLSTFPETDCDASKDGDASAGIANGDASDNGEDDIGMIDMLAFEPIIYQVPTPKQLQSQSKDIVPATLMIAQKVQGQQCPRLLKVLLDSGGGATLFHRSCLPRGATPRMLPEKKEMKTILGIFTPNNEVLLEDIQLPEFDKSRKVDFVNAFIFDEPCRYDVILGRDFLSKAGITICFKSNVMTWLENVVPMRCPTTDKETLEAVLDACYMHDEEYELEIDWLDGYLSNPIPILDAKYEKADIDEVTTMQKHLTKEQQRELATLLRKHEKLFNGTLGLYPHKKVHIDVEPNAKPVHSRAYPIPRVQLETFKRELMHLVRIGVLSPQGASEWASPSFIIPKKDGRVRWISDLRALNKVIKRKQYPLPIITEIIRRRTGYSFFTKLDISMQYYTFELDDESKELCTIVTPFGKFKYNRLPMGLKCSPDIAQEAMDNLFRDIDEAEVYIDDVGAFSNTWTQHIDLLDTILGRLEDNGFTINPLKCEWGIKETDWLGYWLTPHGVKPWKKKIQGILDMQRPTTLKEMRTFLGAVNYYRDLWPRRAHILKPLTDRVGKKEFIWTPEMEKSFKTMKAVVAADALMHYPNHNLPFEIYTDASDYQLGACIMQNKAPVVYFSRKLTGAQRNYTTMEKELLSVVMVCKEYRSMLLGADLHFFTDHKNLTYHNLNSQRVLRWRCYLEEYSPNFHYLPGKDNVLADAFSRLPCLHDEGVEGKSNDELDDLGTEELHSQFRAKRNDNVESFASLLDEPSVFDCFVNLPQIPQQQNPLNYVVLQQNQIADAQLQTLLRDNPQRYQLRDFGDVQLICYVKDGDDPLTQWKIALPENMIQHTMIWFHHVIGHPGNNRLRDTIQARYYHPSLRKKIDEFQCGICEQHKLSGAGYGYLPEREARLAPWTEVAIDLIGPWKLELNGREYEFNALTCIDTVTNLVELIRVDKKTASHIRSKFEQVWLARYPWPQRCVHDNGGEFVGASFQELLEAANIRDVPTSSRNPQSNAICERMHQTVGNILRTLIYSNPPQTEEQAANLVDEALATTMHAMRSAVSRTLGSSPGALAFNRDMFLDVPLLADWHLLQQRREHLINENLRRQNMKRRRWDYVPGQRVWLKTVDPTKLGLRTIGPFFIEQVHTNGTITIERRRGVLERVNIRRVVPSRE